MSRNLVPVSLFISIILFTGCCFEWSIGPAAADAEHTGTFVGDDYSLQIDAAIGTDGHENRSLALDPSRLSAMLLAKDPVRAAVRSSKARWPDVTSNTRPNVVILTDPKDRLSALAASRLLLPSFEGTVLFTARYVTPEATLTELGRLSPSGLPSHAGVQVIAAGNIHQRVVDQVRSLGYRTERIQAAKPEALAGAVDAYTAKLSGKHNKAVIMLPLEPKPLSSSVLRLLHEKEGSILFVKRLFIPRETLQALELRGGGAKIYIPGSLEAVSKQVERRLQRYGEVTRITGDPRGLPK